MLEKYIQVPQRIQPITITKGKVPKVKHVSWEEVPEAYRKKRNIDKLKPYLSEILLYIIGIAEFIRKGIKHERN